MRPLSPKITYTLLGLAVAIIVATWLTLVVWQPTDSNWESLADSRSSTIALIGFTVPAILALIAVVPRLPVRTLTLMPVALALNVILGQVVGTMALPLPLYLDSLGTVLVGALAGPWAGLVTGVLSALVWSTFNPTIIPFAAAYAFVGVCAGLLGKWWAGPWWRIALSALVIGFFTALISAPVASFIFGGTAGTGTGLLVSFYRSLGFDPMTAVFLQSWTSDPIDKLIVFSVIYLVIRAMPQRTLRTFR
ncbi:ECF transporter S component [Corynebacterium falsenii]|uniref:ECF transporter S component n=1 Tax=Corynebacterium falsenii TaxID=108486 RepID=UPI003FD3348A